MSKEKSVSLISDQPEDLLVMKTMHLESLTACLVGDGYESFKQMSGEVQGNVMWLVHDLAFQVRRLVEIVQTKSEG